MGKLMQLSIRNKLYLLSALSLIAVVIVAFSGYRGIERGIADLEEIGNVRLPSVEGLQNIEVGMLQIRVSNVSVAIWENNYNAQPQFEKALHNQQEGWGTLEAGWKEYEPLPQTAEEAVLWKQFTGEFEAWKAAADAASDVVRRLSQNHEEATQKVLFVEFHDKLARVGPLYTAAVTTLKKIIKLNVDVANDANKEAHASGKLAKGTMLSIAAIAITLTLVFGWLIGQSIFTALRAMQTGMKDIAENGDFTKRIAITSHDEIGETVTTFNAMVEKLQTALAEVLSDTQQVLVAAEQLSAASQQVAAGSSNQSEAASSMASAVEELTVSISQVSENAQHAMEVSKQSGQVTDESSTTIESAASEMREISQKINEASIAINNLGQSSESISNIVNVIKEIADQTNLLALNAAIEAARAGEQGRGFAVVADEVRKLSERTSQSTDEITNMINSMQINSREAIASMQTTVAKVDQGVSLANQASNGIVSIKQCARDTSNIANDISASLAEQTAASEDIARKVELVAQMTEENSAAAEQTARTAEQLQSLANHMSVTVHRFKV